MSENVRSFGAVNGTGIANGHKKFFSFILVLRLIFVLHTPISRVLPVVSCHFFIALIEHSLGTRQRAPSQWNVCFTYLYYEYV